MAVSRRKRRGGDDGGGRGRATDSGGVAMDSPPVSGRGDAPRRVERGPGRSDDRLGVGADLTSSVSPN